jgi:hypothetical protein
VANDALDCEAGPKVLLTSSLSGLPAIANPITTTHATDEEMYEKIAGI